MNTIIILLSIMFAILSTPLIVNLFFAKYSIKPIKEVLKLPQIIVQILPTTSYFLYYCIFYYFNFFTFALLINITILIFLWLLYFIFLCKHEYKVIRYIKAILFISFFISSYLVFLPCDRTSHISENNYYINHEKSTIEKTVTKTYTKVKGNITKDYNVDTTYSYKYKFEFSKNYFKTDQMIVFGKYFIKDKVPYSKYYVVKDIYSFKPINIYKEITFNMMTGKYTVKTLHKK